MTGYDAHCRQLVRAMYKQNKNIYLNCNKPQGWEAGCPDDIFDMCSKVEPYNDGTTVAVMFPHQWPMVWDEGKEFIGFLVWEGDRIPEFWLEYICDNKVKQVWVPSNHTKQAILNTYEGKVEQDRLEDKIKIVPHGVDTKLFNPEDKRDKKFFTFLQNKGWRAGENDRGGVQFGLEAFTEEFKEDEPVRMIVKINPSYNSPDWNLDNEIKKIGVKPHKNLFFNVNSIPFNQLFTLYNQADCFVAPTMSESFGLPILEAMACDLPVITTDFGGQTDFVNSEGCKDDSWIVDTELVPANDGFMYEGINWGKPDVKQLKAAMRYAYKKNKLHDNKEFIKKWTWDESAKKAFKYIQ